MLIKQISVFIENKQGRLEEITAILGKNDIDIRALSIADTTDFGILRMIVSDHEKANKALKEEGITVKTTDVIGICVSDTPGGLNTALQVLGKNNIGVEYMYSYITKLQDQAQIILRVENNQKAIDILRKNNIEIVENG